jgi:hypothetical protein
MPPPLRGEEVGCGANSRRVAPILQPPRLISAAVDVRIRLPQHGPAGAEACSRRRKPPEFEAKSFVSPAGAADGRSPRPSPVAPAGLWRFHAARIPEAYASGYMPAPLRGEENCARRRLRRVTLILQPARLSNQRQRKQFGHVGSSRPHKPRGDLVGRCRRRELRQRGADRLEAAWPAGFWNCDADGEWEIGNVNRGASTLTCADCQRRRACRFADPNGPWEGIVLRVPAVFGKIAAGAGESAFSGRRRRDFAAEPVIAAAGRKRRGGDSLRTRGRSPRQGLVRISMSPSPSTSAQTDSCVSQAAAESRARFQERPLPVHIFPKEPHTFGPSLSGPPPEKRSKSPSLSKSATQSEWKS